jgi:malate dehydrogenase (oxaloacetate-decarboxylating)
MFLFDRAGLLQFGQTDLQPFQLPYAKEPAATASWKVADRKNITLEETVINAKPTILIGCSTVTGAFTPAILKQMATNSPAPRIMPLSNPTSKAEATPEVVLASTAGKALLATGSPFGQVLYSGQKIDISQCNNALIFPGLGMGMLISRARMLSDKMLLAASNAVTESAVNDNRPNSLLPDFNRIEDISARVAIAVAMQATAEGLCPSCPEQMLYDRLNQISWWPEYREF